MRNSRKRISKGLFRYAVELELIMKILAEEKHFSKDRLEEMRKEAIIMSAVQEARYGLTICLNEKITSHCKN